MPKNLCPLVSHQRLAVQFLRVSALVSVFINAAGYFGKQVSPFCYLLSLQPLSLNSVVVGDARFWRRMTRILTSGLHFNAFKNKSNYLMNLNVENVNQILPKDGQGVFKQIHHILDTSEDLIIPSVFSGSCICIAITPAN